MKLTILETDNQRTNTVCLCNKKINTGELPAIHSQSKKGCYFIIAFFTTYLVYLMKYSEIKLATKQSWKQLSSTQTPLQIVTQIFEFLFLFLLSHAQVFRASNRIYLHNRYYHLSFHSESK